MKKFDVITAFKQLAAVTDRASRKRGVQAGFSAAFVIVSGLVSGGGCALFASSEDSVELIPAVATIPDGPPGPNGEPGKPGRRVYTNLYCQKNEGFGSRVCTLASELRNDVLVNGTVIQTTGPLRGSVDVVLNTVNTAANVASAVSFAKGIFGGSPPQAGSNVPTVVRNADGSFTVVSVGPNQAAITNVGNLSGGSKAVIQEINSSTMGFGLGSPQ